jgi:hypothetical protein
MHLWRYGFCCVSECEVSIGLQHGKAIRECEEDEGSPGPNLGRACACTVEISLTLQFDGLHWIQFDVARKRFKANANMHLRYNIA